MGQILHVVNGKRPWQPTLTAVSGEVFDYYDVPRVGLLHESGDTFIFTCLLGEDGALSVWTYSPINEVELKELLTASGPQQFDALIERLLRDRWVTVAVAQDDLIVHSVPFDAGLGGSDELLERLANQLERLDDSADKVRHLAAACG
jgi:hypothetical protein